MKRKILYRGLIVILIFGVGFCSALVYQKRTDARLAAGAHSIREKDTTYKFISPLLAYDNNVILNEDANLQDKIDSIIDSYKEEKGLESASVYIRNSGTGKWVGINEDQKYNPASMLKVVIMIAYFKESETDSKLLSQTYAYDGEGNSIPFEAPSVLKVKQSYTVEELINRMIIDSDNGAMTVLLNNIQPQVLNEVYSDLGLQSPGDSSGDYVISAKSYSLFFRILYNATYLNRDLSEKALGILSQATYKEALVAGVPSDIKVAHKFGEHVNGDPTNGVINSIELGDCGFVYPNTNPYFICVMTKGKNLQNLNALIKDISQAVYQEVTR
jgi:beta-lactamase class A